MEAFAHVKYVRMSPRKVKLVCDMIRGKDVKTAAAYLSQTSKAACEPMAKLLKSAVANAEHNHQMNAVTTFPCRCRRSRRIQGDMDGALVFRHRISCLAPPSTELRPQGIFSYASISQWRDSPPAK